MTCCGLDYLGADEIPASSSRRTFTVDRKDRGEDTYVLHGAGDASAFVPGGSLYTPDGIIWDLIAIDADKKGLTVSKKRDDVSFTAWLLGDWSKLSGDVPVKETPWMHDFAMSARETAYDVKEGAKAGAGAAMSAVKYLPWILGGVAVVGLGAAVAPAVASAIARRAATAAAAQR